VELEYVGIIPESEDASIWEVFGKEVSRPENSILRPSGQSVAGESVDKDDAGGEIIRRAYSEMLVAGDILNICALRPRELLNAELRHAV
jgi:hypothetical protein